MFDDSNSFVYFLSHIAQSVCKEKQELHNSSTLLTWVFYPPFSIYSSPVYPCVSHTFECPRSRYLSFLHRSEVKMTGINYLRTECLSYGLVFYNGKTTKNDVASFCNKHICINFILLTNGHTIRIFRGKYNVSPMIIFNIFCFPSISLLKSWHNN